MTVHADDPRGVGARRWWALVALVLAGLMVGLDSTILSVALPTLARSLHASESDLEWFSSGYLLVLAAAMLPLGLLGDRYGRKNVLLASFFCSRSARRRARLRRPVARSLPLGCFLVLPARG